MNRWAWQKAQARAEYLLNNFSSLSLALTMARMREWEEKQPNYILSLITNR